MKPPSKSIARRSRSQGKPGGELPATPREAAFEAIRRHVERFPDLLPAEPRCDRLDARDAALARALYDSTVRRWRTLAFLLNTRLRRPMHTLEPGLQAALLVGAAQILLMDRVPDHAAINESVEWTKLRVRPGAAKMANAVLRALIQLRVGREELPDVLNRRDAIALGEGYGIVLAEALLPDDAVERTALSTGLTSWLVGRWHTRLGEVEARRQCLHTLAHAPVIVNVTHATAPLGEMEAWPDHAEPGFKVAPPTASIGAALGERDDVWVQDPSSAAPVASLEDISARVIIDVCAGQGTKTRQLLARFPHAQVIASDTDERRMAMLTRLAVRHDALTVCAAADLAFEHGAKADLVLLDVPCTNTGVLARRLEARHRCSPRQLERLLETQRQIIADSIRLLAPGGSVLYATCSLEPEECEDQAAWTTKWHGLGRAAAGARTPREGEGYADGSRWVLLGGGAVRR